MEIASCHEGFRVMGTSSPAASQPEGPKAHPSRSFMSTLATTTGAPWPRSAVDRPMGDMPLKPASTSPVCIRIEVPVVTTIWLPTTALQPRSRPHVPLTDGVGLGSFYRSDVAPLRHAVKPDDREQASFEKKDPGGKIGT
ncbi:hypothetical protein MMC30_008617 [Trapelia coarctata]|nr:hypothetical protein [Trapelia coarctata]